MELGMENPETPQPHGVVAAFLGLFAFLTTLQDPAPQVVPKCFRHSLCLSQELRRTYSSIALSVCYLLKRYRYFASIVTLAEFLLSVRSILIPLLRDDGLPSIVQKI
jgi:hypothetical protein